MQPLIFLDVETTGFDKHTDKIIEIGLVKWQDQKIIETFGSLVNPQRNIPKEITLLTGITQEQVATAPLFDDLRDKINDFIGILPVVGHNIQFDTGFLRSHGVTITGAEIDSVELAQILLLKESSYSLEILMKKYGETQRGSHRALEDTLTTVDFFEFLLKRIDSLPKAITERLQKLFSVTKWSGKTVFEERIGEKTWAEGGGANDCGGDGLGGTKNSNNDNGAANGGLGEKLNTDTHENEAACTDYEPQQPWGKNICEQIAGQKNILLESPYDPDFSLLKDKKTIFSYNQRSTRELVERAAKKHNVPLKQYKSANQYLSPIRLEEALENPEDAYRYIPFLAKMIIWAHETVTGDREEVSLRREEFSFFNAVCDRDGIDVYSKKSLVESKKSDWLIAHHASIWNNESGTNDDTKIATKRDLLVLDSGSLEDSITNSTRVKISQSDLSAHFGDHGTLITGILGIFYEKQKGYSNDSYSEDVLLDENMTQSIEWKRLIESLGNLPENSEKQAVIDAFNFNPSECIATVSFFADELSFSRIPLFLGETFAHGIDGANSVLLHGYSLSGGGSFTLTKELFELDSSWHSIIEKAQEIDPIDRQLILTIPDYFPEPNSEGFFRESVVLFKRLIEEHRGRCLFIVNSKQSASAIHSALNDFSQTIGVRILSIGQSGGVGKVLTHYNDDPDHSVVIATNTLLPQVEELLTKANVVVLNKVPFDPPFSPVFKIRSSQFEDGWNDYALPRALIKFRHMLVMLGHGHRRNSPTSPQRQLCVLDSRLRTKGYGRLFVG